MLADKVHEHAVGRQIATVGETLGQILILIVVEIVVVLVDVEKAVRAQAVQVLSSTRWQACSELTPMR